MKNRPVAVIILLLPLLLGMRDPFEPVIDPCRTAQLSLLRYGGGIESGPRLIGFLRDDSGKWRRVEQENMLTSHWRIADVARESVTIALAAGCEPAQWRIITGEVENDNKDKRAARIDAAAAGRQ